MENLEAGTGSLEVRTENRAKAGTENREAETERREAGTGSLEVGTENREAGTGGLGAGTANLGAGNGGLGVGASGRTPKSEEGRRSERGNRGASLEDLAAGPYLLKIEIFREIMVTRAPGGKRMVGKILKCVGLFRILK